MPGPAGRIWWRGPARAILHPAHGAGLRETAGRSPAAQPDRPAAAVGRARCAGRSPMKIAITGKGGVGKTTLTALLAYAYADRGYHVLAIDADPSPCLGAALGFPHAQLETLTPIARMEELIYE